MLKTIPDIVSEIRSRVRCVTAEEALAESADNGGTIIDVRDSEEVALKPVGHSMPISRGMLEMKVLTNFPNADTPLYVHCATGIRASFAAEQLQRLGYRKVAAIGCDLDTIQASAKP